MSTPKGKITITHYLNKRLKPKKQGKEAQYRLYVQVSVKRQQAQIKSHLNEYLSEQTLATRQEELDAERQQIITIIESLNPFDRDDFHITEFSRNYELFHQDIREGISVILKYSLHYAVMQNPKFNYLSRLINWESDVSINHVEDLLKKVIGPDFEKELGVTANILLYLYNFLFTYPPYKSMTLYHWRFKDGKQTFGEQVTAIYLKNIEKIGTDIHQAKENIANIPGYIDLLDQHISEYIRLAGIAVEVSEYLIASDTSPKEKH